MESVRSTERWGVEPRYYADPAEFLAQRELRDGIHTVQGAAAPIDFLMRIKPGRPLILSFHGNTPRNPKLKLPIFTGLNVTTGLDASFVALSDPSLYLDPDLKLAWFAGCAGLDLQQKLPALLDKIIRTCGASDVICFGGSGGGFASLYYSAGIANSIALVWNPQTDITRYNPPHVEEYGRAAFGLETYEQAKAGLGSLIECDLSGAYADRRENLILYLQNNSDGHVVTHMQPFLENLGSEVGHLQKGVKANARVADGVWLYLDSWGEGHVPPPTPFLGALLRGIVADPARWREDFRTGRLAQVIESTLVAS